MTPFRDMRLPHAYQVTLGAPDDFEGWRDQARRLVQCDVPPDRVVWDAPGSAATDLFAQGDRRLPVPAAGAAQPRASRQFLQLAQSVTLHSDPERFSLLYRLLWRLQAQPRLMEDAADADVGQADRLARQVRRDIHKMRAFLRFRVVEEDSGAERYVAWFEPEHHILRANAGFFVRRFTTMRWSILTPQGTLHWDGESLQEGPPAERADAPSGDPTEDLWRRYYASIFNPARLKIGAMLKEMPRKYWKNMPEAALIPELVATAQAREATMVDSGRSMFEDAERPANLEQIANMIEACRRCPIGCNGTHAVAGEGPSRAPLMIVGEQPGDVEEQQGRPFVGPAGRLLRSHLEDAGLDLGAAWLTNAVKHFKFVPRGKRRLHQSPTAKEIDTCRWWVDSERLLVRPRLILALGASAARGLLGRTVSVQKERSRPHALEDGAELWITTHPSYLLRLQDDARAGEEARFAQDLRTVAGRLAELTS
ncbi:UdgX family uracil-DNA binding protein [Novosphingobium huizhouense]|uniref:UdgX family uracil-DNA binding protein n=1 Tax=Novosphingobium huizhouense TaxID=2866625 RepID=UPI001CD89720|nr:UdgX family uracil-DNA binding protein [Novosphingobium huizhouense]